VPEITDILDDTILMSVTKSISRYIIVAVGNNEDNAVVVWFAFFRDT